MPDVNILVYFDAYSPNIMLAARIQGSYGHKGRKMCRE